MNFWNFWNFFNIKVLEVLTIVASIENPKKIAIKGFEPDTHSY